MSGNGLGKQTWTITRPDQLLRAAEPLRDIVAFHCQQAAEKYLKALLVYHQVEFRRTHNLRELVDLLSGVAPEIALALDRAAILTPYGVDIRYPGDFPDVLPGQEQEAFQIVQRVKEAVLKVLVPTPPLQGRGRPPAPDP